MSEADLEYKIKELRSDLQEQALALGSLSMTMVKLVDHVNTLTEFLNNQGS